MIVCAYNQPNVVVCWHIYIYTVYRYILPGEDSNEQVRFPPPLPRDKTVNFGNTKRPGVIITGYVMGIYGCGYHSIFRRFQP